MKHKGDININYNWCALNDPQMVDKGARTVGKRRTTQYRPNYSIVNIGQDPKKSSGDLTWGG